MDGDLDLLYKNWVMPSKFRLLMYSATIEDVVRLAFKMGAIEGINVVNMVLKEAKDVSNTNPES